MGKDLAAGDKSILRLGLFDGIHEPHETKGNRGHGQLFTSVPALIPVLIVITSSIMFWLKFRKCIVVNRTDHAKESNAFSEVPSSFVTFG